jgi:hypothetical protein
VAAAEQLLANLVRLRYRDGATFLAVTNISTQFELNTTIDLNGTIVTHGGGDSVGIGGGVGYSERPTISFSIMGGEKFQKRLLRPVGIASISLVAGSGWRGDRVLRLTAEALNGLPNAPTASGPTPSEAPRYADFLEATRLINELHIAGAVRFEYVMRRQEISAPLPLASISGSDTVSAVKAGVSFERVDDDHVQLYAQVQRLVLRVSPAAGALPEVARLRDLLRLDPSRNRYEVVELGNSDFDPLDPEKRVKMIGVASRSLMAVLYYLSNGVEVPPEDVAAGVVTKTVDANGAPFDWTRVLGKLFAVHSSDGMRRPKGAALAIRHRDHWFYIADDDQTTKSTFLLLGELFTLQAGDVEELKPVLTLPVGG